MNTVIYDKASWHYPEGCSELKAAVAHIDVALRWLEDHNMLTREGKEVLELGVDEEASITSRMLTEQGQSIMDAAYASWLKKVTYTGRLSTASFDKVVEARSSD